MKQYAASPVIQQLIADRDTYFPTLWQDQFYNMVWNVDTAQGFGLDIWGRIVVIGRNIEIPDDDNVLGFANGTTPPDWQPFNNGTFSTGVQSTQTFTLADDAYRVLILTKALANISSVDARSMNRILQNLFPGRGRCYVNDLGSMQMRYTFEFALEPWEQTILVNGGALPRPAGVKAFVATIPTGDSSTFGFAEQGIGQVVADPVPQVFRYNWQGVELLYTTPRSNLFTFSEDFSNAAWTKLNTVVSAPVVTSPAGTNSGNLVTGSSAGNSYVFRSITQSVSCTVSFFVSPGSLTTCQLYATNPSVVANFSLTGSGTASIVGSPPAGTTATIKQVANGFYMVSLTLVYTGAGNTGLIMGVGTLNFFSAQFQPGTLPSSYIATTASPVTVTDYSATSTQVTLSSPLAIDANLLWSGTYTNQLTGQTVMQSQASMGAGTGTTSIYPFSGTFTPNSVAPFNQGTFLSSGAINNAA